MLTVTGLAPWQYEADPIHGHPIEVGIAGLLEVTLDDGRELWLAMDDLPSALRALEQGRAILDDEDLLCLDVLSGTDVRTQLILQLRIGVGGPEVGALICQTHDLANWIRQARAVMEDAAYAWGLDELFTELHEAERMH